MLKKMLLIIGIAILVIIIAVFSVYYTPDLTKEDLSAYVNDASSFLNVENGGTIHYRDEGSKDNPAIVLIHGGYGSLHNWQEWTALLKDKYRVVSLDLPGHGLTSKWAGEDYSRESMKKAIDALVNHLDISKFSMAGNSMGGGITLEYVLANPNKVESIILLGSGGMPVSEKGGYSTSVDTSNRYTTANREFYKLSFLEKLASKFMGKEDIKDFLLAYLGNKSMITNEFVDWYYNIIRYNDNRANGILCMKQWINPSTPERDLEPRLNEINIPVLYQHGVADTIVPINVAKRFERLLPDCQLIIYENAGHMPQIEQPQKTAKDVLTFLETVCR